MPMSSDAREIADGIMARTFGDDWASPSNGTVVAERRAFLRDIIAFALIDYGDARYREGVEAALKAAETCPVWLLEYGNQRTRNDIANAIRALADTQEPT